MRGDGTTPFEERVVRHESEEGLGLEWWPCESRLRAVASCVGSFDAIAEGKKRFFLVFLGKREIRRGTIDVDFATSVLEVDDARCQLKCRGYGHLFINTSPSYFSIFSYNLLDSQKYDK